MEWVEVTVTDVVQETPLDRSFVLEVPPEARARFDFVPGQYLVLRDPAESPPRDWYFSLSAAPNDEGTLRITVRGRGEAVQRIYAAPPGTAWQARPPAGSFLVAAGPGERVVLAAAGSGVTPFRSFVEQRAGQAGEDAVWLLQCARSPEELLFHDEFARWDARLARFAYVPSVTGSDEAWRGRCGRVDEALLRRALGRPQAARVFACGPAAFVDGVLGLAAELGVPEEQRIREAW